jgi:hypothetical protein
VLGDSIALIGPQRVDRAEMVGHLIAEQDRRTDTLVIAEIGTVLTITDQGGEVGRESSRDWRRISEPLILIGL